MSKTGSSMTCCQSANRKDTHPWQQALPEAMYIVEHLTRPNDLVLDTCVGGGTTLVAAERLCRPWVGFEIDKTTHRIATDRILEDRNAR